ncbi:carbohydrate-responsive element-binding protein-like [Elysia marginata]|uniref:Carbohydrate-responsive element-binding protein-like n=1 Tax=Elysia marginata TaxID=1093978 RepID=A0AAV4GHD2_9GAST|nr:carbohydrate-responsive element-binding protein-like [Elysia marginata]
MTAAGAFRDLQHVSSFANVLHSAVGDELPSLSCDLGEVNSTEFEQLLLQGLSDPYLMDLHHLSVETVESGGSSVGDLTSSPTCDLASFFLEDVARPRDLQLSFPGENQGRTTSSFISSLLEATGPNDNGAGSLQEDKPKLQQHQPLSFFYPLSPAVQPPSHSPAASSSIPSFDLKSSGDKTPPTPGGLTPQNISRASSPVCSESSGNMGCISNFQDDYQQRSRHHSRSSIGSNGEASGNPVPRHKRPSHKRAEVKRRDKIKSCLEDMKDAVPSLRDKGKLSESAILIKASEYIHHLKDGQTERGKKSAELRREIEFLNKEIHSFQENLPAAGLKEEPASPVSLDDLYQSWQLEQSQNSTKFCIFSAITSKMWESFKEVVGPVTNFSGLSSKAQEWQTNCLALPVLRKQILAGLLSLSRQNSIAMTSDPLNLVAGSPVDASSCDAKS